MGDRNYDKGFIDGVIFGSVTINAMMKNGVNPVTILEVADRLPVHQAGNDCMVRQCGNPLSLQIAPFGD